MRPARNPKYVTFGPKETIVTFTSARGELRTNDSGEFFLRNMADGRFTCASPDLERQLLDAGVRAGMPVGITRNIYNRVAIWKVRIVGRVTQMPARESAANTTSQPKLNGLPERVYAKVEPPPPVFPECDPAAAPSTQVATAPAASLPVEGGLIWRSLREAIDAAKAGQAHAAAIGFPLTFSSSDIQDLASTIFIQRCRDGAIVERIPAARQNKPNGSADAGAYHA
jgi:hypothetical protein